MNTPAFVVEGIARIRQAREEVARARTPDTLGGSEPVIA